MTHIPWIQVHARVVSWHDVQMVQQIQQQASGVGQDDEEELVEHLLYHDP